MAKTKKATGKKKRAARPEPEMSDRELARLAQEHKEIKNRIKALEAKAGKRKDVILAELERRGLKAIETEEVRVTMVQRTVVNYHVDQLKERLGPSKFKRITKPVVDKDALAEAVQQGKVNMEDVDACSSLQYQAPYITVSPRGK